MTRPKSGNARTERLHDLAFLHRPADLRDGVVRRHYLDRPDLALCLAGCPVSPDHAARRQHLHQLPRRQRTSRRGHRSRAHRAASQRRRRHAVHVVAIGQRRHLLPDGDLRHRHRPEDGDGQGSEPCGARDAAIAHRSPKPGHHHPEENARHPDDRQPLLARQPLRRHLPQQLRHHLHQGRATTGRASRTSPTRASATTASAAGSIRKNWRLAT